MNSNLLKRCIKYTLLLIIMLMLTGSIIVWKSVSYFINNRHDASPITVAFMKSLAGSINTEYVDCADKTRCLLLTPIKNSIPEKRAQHLRNQLLRLGIKPLPYGEIQGIVVILHGKNSYKENSIYAALRLTAAGFIVIIPDLPGHGENELPYAGFGTLEGETEIAIDALNYTRKHIGAENLPAALWGYSMGGSYANYTIAKYPHHFKVLVIQSSFDSMEALAEDKLKFIPSLLYRPLIASFRVLIKIRSGIDIEKISPVTAAHTNYIPVIQVHGEQDQTIPYIRGKILHQAYPSNKKLFITVPDGDHNDSLNKATLTYAPICAFILTNLSGQLKTL